MKKLLSILVMTLAGASVQAQNKPLACQDDMTGGLNWENGRWVTSTFKADKFILVQTGDTLTRESVAKALNTSRLGVSCSNSNVTARISCTDNFQYFLFNTNTLKGGISNLLGTTMPDGTYKDSVYVRAFTCQPF